MSKKDPFTLSERGRGSCRRGEAGALQTQRGQCTFINNNNGRETVGESKTTT